MSDLHVRIEQIRLKQALTEVGGDPVVERLREDIHDAEYPTTDLVLQLAEDVLVGDAEWVDRPHPELGGVTP